MKLIFATNNQHKIDEIRSVLGKKIEIITLKEAGLNIDIPEPYNTCLLYTSDSTLKLDLAEILAYDISHIR